MPKPPPSTSTLLDQVRRVTDQAWSQPFFDDPGGAIAPFRGWAASGSYVAAVGSRSASRQFFVTPPGFEAADFGGPARGVAVMQRTQWLELPLLVRAGAMTFVAPSGRRFANTEDVLWYPAPDPNPTRSIVIAADVIGEVGNLDAYAAPDGSLTDPTTGGPDLRALDLQALSQQRAGTKATLTLATGEPASLTTSGVAPTWVPSDVGLHLLIASATNPANVGRLLRIVSWSASETPGPDGYYTRTVQLDDGPQPALVSAALLDDGGVVTDYTGAAQAGEANTVPLLPVVPAVGDAFYFGGDTEFALLELEITTRRFGDLVLAWEWWDGALWQPAVDLVDAALAPATRRAYEESWARFCTWCKVIGIDDPYTATVVDVSNWVTSQIERHLSASYIRRQLAALTWAFDTTGLMAPTRHPIVRRAVAGAGRNTGRPVVRSTPLTLAETASVFGEMLTFRALLANAKDQGERKILLAGKVEDMINTVVRQIAFYSFERAVHTGLSARDHPRPVFIQHAEDNAGVLAVHVDALGERRRQFIPADRLSGDERDTSPT